MCRTAGRRCPCDTSQARNNRRHNQKMRLQHSDSLQKTSKSQNVSPKVGQALDVARLREEVASLHELLEDYGRNGSFTSAEKAAELDAQVIRVGEHVQQLAEQKYGAPSDDEIKEIKDKAEDATSTIARYKEDIANAERDTIHKEFNKRYEELREKIGLRNPRFKTALFARMLELHENGLSSEDYDELNKLKIEAESEKSTIKLRNYYAGINKKIDELQPEVDDAKAKVSKKLAERAQAYKKALEDAGVEFASKESLSISEDSHKAAAKSVQEALPYFPKQWVEMSNEAAKKTPLRIKKTQGRAHYSALQPQKKVVKSMWTKEYLMDEGWTPDPYDSLESSFVEAEIVDDPDIGLHYVDPVGRRHMVDPVPAGKKMWVELPYQTHRIPSWVSDTENYKPRGRGWEKTKLYIKHYNHDERRWDQTTEPETVWRRLRTSQRKETDSYKAQVTISPSETPEFSKDSGYRVALHEMSHRFEDTVPGVFYMEDAFLKRRAGHLDGTTHGEQASTIFRGSKEYGYKDNFASHYMGKVYNGSAREILSMGMESIFAGTHNGLSHGVDSVAKPDRDYRNFILGVLCFKGRQR